MVADPIGATAPRRRRGTLRAALALAAFLTGLVAVPAASLAGVASGGPLAAEGTGRATVGLTEITGPITPVTASHLADTTLEAAAAGHAALVVRLDTPGGLVDATRKIVQSFLDAPLPVVVYVAPSGADAGSAGTFITYAAHIAAMAPATTIGAATPIGGQGEDLDAKIIENAAAFAEAIAEARDRDVEFAVEAVRAGRSITAESALEVGAVDLISRTLSDLLIEIDGTEVEIGGATVTLATADATIVEMPMGTAARILGILADPNLAFIFLSIGTLAILYEIANPGIGLGGVIGAVCIILAMFAFAVLPVNAAGIALLLLAAGMFIAELFAPGIGAGAGGGTVALLLGGLFLFPADSGLGVDLQVLLPTAAVVFAMTVLAGRLVARSRSAGPVNYSDHLSGRTVTVAKVTAGHARGQLDGTWWRLRPAAGADPLAEGDEVVIIGRDNLDLLVERADPTAASPSGPPTDHPSDRPTV